MSKLAPRNGIRKHPINYYQKNNSSTQVFHSRSRWGKQTLILILASTVTFFIKVFFSTFLFNSIPFIQHLFTILKVFFIKYKIMFILPFYRTSLVWKLPHSYKRNTCILQTLAFCLIFLIHVSQTLCRKCPNSTLILIFSLLFEQRFLSVTL